MQGGWTKADAESLNETACRISDEVRHSGSNIPRPGEALAAKNFQDHPTIMRQLGSLADGTLAVKPFLTDGPLFGPCQLARYVIDRARPTRRPHGVRKVRPYGTLPTRGRSTIAGAARVSDSTVSRWPAGLELSAPPKDRASRVNPLPQSFSQDHPSR